MSFLEPTTPMQAVAAGLCGKRIGFELVLAAADWLESTHQRAAAIWRGLGKRTAASAIRSADSDSSPVMVT